MLRLRRAFAAAAAALLALTAVPAGATEPAPQPETTPEATRPLQDRRRPENPPRINAPRNYGPTAASFTSSEWTSRAASGTNPASLS